MLLLVFDCFIVTAYTGPYTGLHIKMEFWKESPVSKLELSEVWYNESFAGSLFINVKREISKASEGMTERHMK